MQNEIRKKIDIRESILNDVAEILISALHVNVGASDLDPDTPLFGTGLGLDSVDAVVLIVELESRLNVSISEEEGRKALRTINSLTDLIISKKYDNA